MRNILIPGLALLKVHIQISGIQVLPTLECQFFSIGSEKYFKKHSWKFCFGETTRKVTLELLRQEIYALISNRDIILVVHGGSGPDGGQEFLKAANINLKPAYIIDTFNPGMLSNAGNMANFTLRAFMLLATLDATNATGVDLKGTQALVSALEKIGREFVPLEKFIEEEKIQEQKEYSRAQNRRQRINARLKEQKTTKKYVLINEADLKALRETEAYGQVV
ncbi:hypothetical protein ACEPPN_009092 [Leptodophora sp. 'Broadleaf-Isolate-01']